MCMSCVIRIWSAQPKRFTKNHQEDQALGLPNCIYWPFLLAPLDTKLKAAVAMGGGALRRKWPWRCWGPREAIRPSSSPCIPLRGTWSSFYGEEHEAWKTRQTFFSYTYRARQLVQLFTCSFLSLEWTFAHTFSMHTHLQASQGSDPLYLFLMDLVLRWPPLPYKITLEC